MTTAVTIDAHAGWPVSVTLVRVHTNQDGTLTESHTSEMVEANTKKIYYIHSGMYLQSVREIQKDS